MKKIRYIALAVCLLYVCFFTGCMFIDSVPAYDDRVYRKIEQAEVDAVLDELRSILQPGKTVEDFIRAFRKAETLLKELDSYSSMMYVSRLRDLSNEEIRTERNRITSLYNWFYNELRDFELELSASPAKTLMLEAFGESYVNKLNNSSYTDDEKNALKDEDSRLRNEYNVFMGQNDAQGMIDVYVDLIKVRNKLAKSYGFDSYSEYRYSYIYNRDYTPDQVGQLVEYAKKWLAPLYDDTLGYDWSVLDNTFSEEEFMSLLDNSIEYLGEKSLQNSLRHMKEKNLYEYSISPSNSKQIHLYYLPSYGDSFLYIQAAGRFEDYFNMMRNYGRYTASYLGDDSLYLFGLVGDLTEALAMGMDALTVPLYSQLFSEEFAAAAKAYKANYYGWVILRNLAYDAFEQFAYSLDEETLNSPDIGDILNQEFKRLLTELNVYSEGRMFYMQTYFYHYSSYFISYPISLFTALQFVQPTINGVPSTDVYAKLAKCGEYDFFMSAINRAGLNSPFEEAAVQSAAEVIIRLLEESGHPADLSDWLKA